MFDRFFYDFLKFERKNVFTKLESSLQDNIILGGDFNCVLNNELDRSHALFLESEPKAVHKYEEQTKAKVCQTGLWVNPKFSFLGCSPDGVSTMGWSQSSP